MAKDLFEKDKMAYIFDSNLSNTQLLSHQVETNIKILENESQQLIKYFNFRSRKFTKKGQEEINSRKNHFSFSIMTMENDGGFTHLKTLKSRDKKSSIIADGEIENMALFKSQLLNNQSVLRKTKEQGVFTLTSLYKVEDTDKKYATILYFKSSELLKSFQSKGIFKNFLVYPNGKVLLGNHLLWEVHPEQFTNWEFFKSISKNNIKSGTIEAKSDGQTNLLVSFSRVKNTNLKVISFVSKEIAVSAVKRLNAKSLLFVICLVCASIIISLLASSKLTQSMHKLYDAAISIKGGDFNISVVNKSAFPDEIDELTDTFNEMSQKILSLLTELKEHNETLEIKVKERTAELNDALILQKAMLNSLGQGFFIFEKDGNILPVYSNAAVEMFGTEPSGKFIGDLMKIPSKERESFKDFCSELFAESLPFEDMIALAPVSIENEKNKKIFFDYNPIRGEDGKLTGTVVVSTDKTKEIAALADAKAERTHVKLILSMVENKFHFINFLNESRNLIKKMNDAISSKFSQSEKVDTLFRLTHTLKGSSGLFHLSELENLSHTYENELSDMRKNIEQDYSKQISSYTGNTAKLTNIIDNFIEDNKNVLGLDSKDMKTSNLVLPTDNIKKFISMIEKSSTIKKNFFNLIVGQPINFFLQPYDILIQEISKQLKKEVAPLKISGGEILIYGEFYKELLSSLVHGFRNSLDHGIEDPDLREERGKKRAGQISVKVSKSKENDREHINLEIKDDGNGIDPEKIRNKLIESTDVKSQLKQFKEESSEEVIQHIFRPGLSTNINVTNFSGRGVGMDAIKNIVDDMGGSIYVTSKLGVNTIIKISVPFIEI